jgi:tetratricopeptide (TPR) repeat protein
MANSQPLQQNALPGAPQLFALAVERQQAGDFQQAEQLCRQILQAEPRHAEALHLLGVLALQTGKHDAAIDLIRRALQLKPDFVDALNNLGLALKQLGKLDDAAESFRGVIRLKPDHAEAYNSLGTIMQEPGNLLVAAANFRQAIHFKPDFPAAHSNLGNALDELGHADEALDCYRQALLLKPDFVPAYNGMGMALESQGKLEEALASFQHALRLQPGYADAHLNQGIVRLLLGQWDKGWPDYEWRWRDRKSAPPARAQPLWDGSPLGGRTILLWAEQGLGDTFQFIRYAPLVKERGGQVVVECQPPLLRILARCPGIDRLVAQGSSAAGAMDVHAPLLSLPGILGTTSSTVPAMVPYIHADDRLIEHWRGELAQFPGFKIGIGWQGSPGYRKDRERSIPLAKFAPLARLPGVQLFSLQKGPGREQLHSLTDRIPVIDLADRLDETAGPFMDSAAVLKNLDLLITSDTAIAHLAGALGVPVWVALPFMPDWRWLLQRGDCPWYPTARLFRQNERGNWPPVFERIVAALRQLLARTSPPRSIAVEISPGDLIDRITMLEIGSARPGDAAQLQRLFAEMDTLREVRERSVASSERLQALAAQLREVHEFIEKIEDEIRRGETMGQFGPRFGELVRAQYEQNKRREALKRQIDETPITAIQRSARRP